MRFAAFIGMPPSIPIEIALPDNITGNAFSSNGFRIWRDLVRRGMPERKAGIYDNFSKVNAARRGVLSMPALLRSSKERQAFTLE
jgi:hypothetical protein